MQAPQFGADNDGHIRKSKLATFDVTSDFHMHIHLKDIDDDNRLRRGVGVVRVKLDSDA
jgi:hypothetical protein